MENYGVIYHTEVFVELQLLMTIELFILKNYEAFFGDETFTIEGEVNTNIIMIGLMVVHFFSIIFIYIRKADIENNGEREINGVMRAPTEKFIQNLEFFISCILIGFSIKQLIMMNEDDIR